MFFFDGLSDILFHKVGIEKHLGCIPKSIHALGALRKKLYIIEFFKTIFYCSIISFDALVLTIKDAILYLIIQLTT